MRPAELRITPTAGVTVDRATWCHHGLGVCVDAPPALIDRRSDDDAVLRAEVALALGLASARNPSISLTGEFMLAVQPSIAIALPRRPHAILLKACAAFARVHWLPLVAGTAAIGLALVYGNPVLLHGSICLIAMLLSLVVHELGHALVFNAVSRGVEAAILVVNRGSPHLVRQATPGWRSVAVTVAGPMAPVVATLVASPILLVNIPELVMCSMISASHLLSLLLDSGDGAQLRRDLGRPFPSSPPL